MHQLTGSDRTSKFGDKIRVLKAKPELYVSEFGENRDNISLEKVEEYLVQIIKSGVPLKPMNALHYYLYLQSNKTIAELPPTSHAIVQLLHCFNGPKIECK